MISCTPLVNPFTAACGDDDDDAARGDCAWAADGYGVAASDLCGVAVYDETACGGVCNAAMRPACAFDACEAALAYWDDAEDADDGGCGDIYGDDGDSLAADLTGVVVAVAVVGALAVVGGLVLVLRGRRGGARPAASRQAAIAAPPPPPQHIQMAQVPAVYHKPAASSAPPVVAVAVPQQPYGVGQPYAMQAAPVQGTVISIGH